MSVKDKRTIPAVDPRGSTAAAAAPAFLSASSDGGGDEKGFLLGYNTIKRTEHGGTMVLKRTGR